MNEINKMMKKHAMKGYLITAAVLLLFGIGAAFGGASILWKANHAGPNIFTVKSNELENGKWYEGSNNILLDWYGETEEGRYYVTVTGDEDIMYMGYFVPKADIDKAERIAEETRALWNGETKEYPKEYIQGIGYMQNMTDEERQLFQEFMTEGASSDVSQYLLYRTFHKSSPWAAVKEEDDDFLMFAGAFCIALAIFSVFYWCIGGYRSDVNKGMKRYGITEQMLAQDMYYSRRENKVWFGEKYALFWGAFLTRLVKYEELVWAYVKITSTKHTMYGIIPMGTSKNYELVLIDRDNKEKKISVKSEEAGTDMLKQLTAMAPYIFSGYTEQIAQTRKQNFPILIARVDEDKNRILSKDMTDQTDGGFDSNPAFYQP